MVASCTRQQGGALQNRVGLAGCQHQQEMIVAEGAGGHPHQGAVLAEINHDADGEQLMLEQRRQRDVLGAEGEAVYGAGILQARCAAFAAPIRAC
jgi:hypothetical protein